MRFSEVVFSGAALVSAAWAVTIDTYPTGGVVAGTSYTITYSPADAPATFILRKGLSTNLDTLATLGTATGGTFTWTPETSLVDGVDYALEVTQGSDVNYSAQFGLTGGASSSSSAVSSSATSSAASSSASSASSSSASSASSASITSSASLSSSAIPSSASGIISSSAASNATITSATLSRTTSSRPTATSSDSPPESTGAASILGSSPMALLFGAIAAVAYLN